MPEVVALSFVSPRGLRAADLRVRVGFASLVFVSSGFVSSLLVCFDWSASTAAPFAMMSCATLSVRSIVVPFS
ncbi:hypothetical protein [Brachybacterium paraconglomeratum]|uniref:hypothetical protein n=1 Tax=Brachybacterium paraconglomeratum TaxID=173362 RepID=UPI0022E5C480|nr:hypothetical protein [Brachybacterium paraconglomeratum]